MVIVLSYVVYPVVHLPCSLLHVHSKRFNIIVIVFIIIYFCQRRRLQRWWGRQRWGRRQGWQFKRPTDLSCLVCSQCVAWYSMSVKCLNVACEKEVNRARTCMNETRIGVMRVTSCTWSFYDTQWQKRVHTPTQFKTSLQMNSRQNEDVKHMSRKFTYPTHTKDDTVHDIKIKVEYRD